MDEESGLRQIQETTLYLIKEPSYDDDDSDRTPFRDEFNASPAVSIKKEGDICLISDSFNPNPSLAGTLSPSALTQRRNNMVVSNTSTTHPQEPPKLLSDASRLFDRQGKGYLDSTERALRQLDTDNDGLLTIHNVYDIMKSLQDSQKLSNDLMESLRVEQKKAVTLKKAVLVLVCLAMFLSLANIATSFAAARLAKDTDVSSTGDLVLKGTESRVGTTDKIVDLSIQPLTEETRRRLQAKGGFDWCAPQVSANKKYCRAQGLLDFGLARDMYRQFCPSLKGIGGKCPNLKGGVRELSISCNGIASTIYGGNKLPMQGPTKFPDKTVWFPTVSASTTSAPTTYSGVVQVFDPVTTTCAQKFSAAIICDQDTPKAECIYFANMQAPYCTILKDESNPNFDADALLICG